MTRLAPAWASCFALVLWGSMATAHAAQLSDVSVTREGARFFMDMRIALDAPPAAVFAALQDYPAMPRYNPDLRSVRVEPTDQPDRVRLVTTLHACVLFLCKTLRQEQLMTAEPRAHGGVLRARLLPRAGDFTEGRGLFTVKPCRAPDPRTCLDVRLELVPDFWVPPVIGPWAIRRMLYREAQRTAAGLERVARRSAGESPPRSQSRASPGLTPLRHAELLQQRAEERGDAPQLLPMRRRERSERRLAGVRQREDRAAPVPDVGSPHQVSPLDQPVDETDRAVVANSQPLGKIPHRHLAAPWVSLDGEQRLMLARREAVCVRRLSTEGEEAREQIPEFGEQLVVAHREPGRASWPGSAMSCIPGHVRPFSAPRALRCRRRLVRDSTAARAQVQSRAGRPSSRGHGAVPNQRVSQPRARTVAIAYGKIQKSATEEK